jgi:hypothetical protein
MTLYGFGRAFRYVLSAEQPGAFYDRWNEHIAASRAPGRALLRAVSIQS